MGASISQNTSTMLTNLSNNIVNRTKVTENAKNTCDQHNTIDHCTIKSGGNIADLNTCTLVNSVNQQGSVSNQNQLSNDVAQSLSQSAASSVGFLGVGLASAINSSYTSCAITNTVTNSSKEVMSKVNSSVNSQKFTNCLIEAAGNINLGNISSLTDSGEMQGNVTTYNDISNKVKQTVTQTATATVTGASFGLTIIIVVVIVFVVIKASTGKKSGGASTSSITGGAITNTLVTYTICGGLISACLLAIGIMNQLHGSPCNDNAQCQTANWWNPGFSCSCTDRMTCGLTEPNKTPLQTGVPMLFIGSMISNFNDTDPMYLRRMMIRSVSGYQANDPICNNSGYNCGVFVKLKELSMNSSSQTTKNILNALYVFMQTHCTGEHVSQDDKLTRIIDPSFKGTGDYKPPCVNEIVNVLIPLMPFYVDDTDATQNPSCITTVGSTNNCNNERQNVGGLQKVSDFSDAPDAPKAPFRGAVNIGQKMCYDNEAGSDEAPKVRYERPTMKDGQVTCPSNMTQIWTPNDLGTSLICTTNAAAYDQNIQQAKNDAYANGIFLNDKYKIDGDCNSFYALSYGGSCPNDKWKPIDGTVTTSSCDGKGGTLTLQSTLGSTWGSNTAKNNLAGPFNAFTPNNGWPESTGYSDKHIADTTSDGNWVNSVDNNHLFAKETVMYQSGSGPTRLANNASAHYSGDPQLTDCWSKDNSDGFPDFDYGNSMAAGVGVAITGVSKPRPGLACQTFGTTGNPNRNTRFLTNIADTLPDGSTGVKFSIGDTLNVREDLGSNSVGENNGDILCRAAAGFDGKPGPYPYMLNVVGDDYEGVPDEAYSIDGEKAHNVGYFSPLGNCLVNYQTPSDYDQKICMQGVGSGTIDGNTQQGMQWCMNPVTCAASGGKWQIEKDGVDANACSDTNNVNFSKDGTVDCYPGFCLAPDQICDSSCIGCSQAQCNKPCQWDATTQKCVPGCAPSEGICELCDSTTCTDECSWDARNTRCTYGPLECNKDGSNVACCDYTTPSYLIQIPSAFTSEGVSGSKKDTVNCSPNVFVPDLTGTIGFNADTDQPNSNVRVCHSTSDASFSSDPYTVNCTVSGSNCYNMSGGDDTCPAESFQFGKIIGTVECFYGSNTNAVVYKAGSNYAATQFVAIMSTIYDEWYAKNDNSTSPNGGSMYFMINRIFAWTVMLSESLKTQKYLTSILGLSTLLNDQGIDEDTGLPVLPLEYSKENMEKHLDNNNWARAQPLLFVDSNKNFHFATIEDIYQYEFGEDAEKQIVQPYMKWWNSNYFKQLNQWVYDVKSSNLPSTVAQFTENGMGKMDSDINKVMSELQDYKGTLIGSTGSCNTLWNNRPMNITAIVIAVIIISVLVGFWVKALRS